MTGHIMGYAVCHEERKYEMELTDGQLTPTISPWRRAMSQHITRGADALATLCMRHWLVAINALLTAVVGVAILVPMFFALGWDGLATRIFMAYHLICAQIPSHSYYLLGYQLALCARNLAIYGSLLLGSLSFRYVRRWLAPIGWRWWLVTMLPMALDGGTQLFGWRESNWELCTLTGAIFGLGVCWFLLPMIEAATRDMDERAPLPWRHVHVQNVKAPQLSAAV